MIHAAIARAANERVLRIAARAVAIAKLSSAGCLADQAAFAVFDHIGLRQPRHAQHAVMLRRGPKQIELRIAMLGRADRELGAIVIYVGQRDQAL